MKVTIFLLVFVTFLQAICHAIIVPPYRENRVLEIYVPKNVLQDFEYEPTKQGYRYRYLLFDGTGREEIGFVTDPVTDQGVLTMDALKSRVGDKSRKLSPGALKSAAG